MALAYKPRASMTKTTITSAGPSRSATTTEYMAVKNDHMRATLLCNDAELAKLKEAVKKRMYSTKIGGQPIVTQLLNHVDPEGKTRAKMWSEVAKADKLFDDLLAGNRHKSGKKPKDFKKQLELVKNKIEFDFVCHARKKLSKEKKAKAKAKAVATGKSDGKRGKDVIPVKDEVGAIESDEESMSETPGGSDDDSDNYEEDVDPNKRQKSLKVPPTDRKTRHKDKQKVEHYSWSDDDDGESTLGLSIIHNSGADLDASGAKVAPSREMTAKLPTGSSAVNDGTQEHLVDLSGSSDNATKLSEPSERKFGASTNVEKWLSNAGSGEDGFLLSNGGVLGRMPRGASAESDDDNIVISRKHKRGDLLGGTSKRQKLDAAAGAQMAQEVHTTANAPAIQPSRDSDEGGAPMHLSLDHSNDESDAEFPLAARPKPLRRTVMGNPLPNVPVQDEEDVEEDVPANGVSALDAFRLGAESSQRKLVSVQNTQSGSANVTPPENDHSTRSSAEHLGGHSNTIEDSPLGGSKPIASENDVTQAQNDDSATGQGLLTPVTPHSGTATGPHDFAGEQDEDEVTTLSTKSVAQQTLSAIKETPATTLDRDNDLPPNEGEGTAETAGKITVAVDATEDVDMHDALNMKSAELGHLQSPTRSALRPENSTPNSLERCWLRFELEEATAILKHQCKSAEDEAVHLKSYNRELQVGNEKLYQETKAMEQANWQAEHQQREAEIKQREVEAENLQLRAEIDRLNERSELAESSLKSKLHRSEEAYERLLGGMREGSTRARETRAARLKERLHNGFYGRQKEARENRGFGDSGE